MITLTDIKNYLNITVTTYDNILNDLIGGAVSKAEDYCDRNFQSQEYTELLDGNGLDFIFVKNYPITDITSIEYWDDETGDWTDIAPEEDDINDIVETANNQIILRGYLFPLEDENKNLRIIYTAGYKCSTGTGTISIPVSSKNVTGVSTKFQTELEAGDTIICEGQTFKVATITSDTVATVTSNANATISGKSFTVSNVPRSLRQAIIEMTAIDFNNSTHGKARLGLASENIGSQAAQSYSFKDMNWSDILDKYKNINIG